MGSTSHYTLSNPRYVSIAIGIALMGQGGLLVHIGQGPVQIEMHFYFFAVLAMLAVFGNPMVIVAAARVYSFYQNRNRRSVVWSSFSKSRHGGPSRSQSYGTEHSVGPARSANGKRSPPPAASKAKSKLGQPETTNARVGASV